METEAVTYSWILVFKDSGKYLGWSKAPDKPPCGEPDKLEWAEWGKGLPEGIDEGEWKLIDGELKK
jgi:hypothetical protein